MKIDNRYIWLLPFLIILSKWVIIFYTYRGFDFEFVILSNFNDISYFPFILSLSELNLSPTFNEYFSTEKLITFPIASMFFHALFYKIFGLISYIFLEIIFVTLAYVLIYYLFKEIGFKEKSIILGTIFFFLLPVFLNFSNFFESHNFLNHLKQQIFFYHLVDFRYPRPLITNIFFYTFLIYLLKFYKSQDSSKLNYVFLGILLAMLLQSFIYLFMLAGLSFFIISILKIYKNRQFLDDNLKNFFTLSLIFIIFSLPFFYQLYFAEPDYSQRMGLFHLNFDIKKKIINETLIHFVNLKYLFLILFLSFFYFLIKIFTPKVSYFYNIFFVIFISTFIIPFIFILISPYIIWYKHFFDVKNLVFLLMILFIFIFLIEIFLNKIKINNLFILSSILVLLFSNIVYYKKTITENFLNNKTYIENLNEIIRNSGLSQNQKKLNIFSNSDRVNYFFNLKNQNILFPQGFHVALNDNQLEILMINSLKSIGFNESNFLDFIKNKISWKSSNEIGQITGFKYQFNSLFTYFDLNDYQTNELNFLNENNLFLSESIALSKSATNELLNKFISHKIIDQIKPDLLIVDKRKNDIDFIVSKDYSEVTNNKFFILFSLKK